MRRKLPAKGTSQLRDHLFPPARVNTVTTWVENKKVQLVDIAHNVGPIMLEVFLLALCHKMGVPYCMIKGKARLETLVYRNT